jgi:hypothetical protein
MSSGHFKYVASLAYPQGAALDLPKKAVFTDKETGIEIKIIEKLRDSYRTVSAR